MSGGRTVQFCIGDRVREGLRVGTVTDVGTLLIQIRTTTGITRMVCPWELVRVCTQHDRHRPGPAPECNTEGP